MAIVTNVVQFIGDNRSWIFDGIGGVVFTSIVGLIVFYFGWWQKRERLEIAPKKFSLAYDLEFRIGGFDVETMQHTSTRARVGIEPAKLKILCHNLTATPVILADVELLNADGEMVAVRQDANAQRIDAHASGEIEVLIGSPSSPCYQCPSWHGQVRIKTIRKKVFSSPSFNFGDLI
jgi:hypothetical protein